MGPQRARFSNSVDVIVSSSSSYNSSQDRHGAKYYRETEPASKESYHCPRRFQLSNLVPAMDQVESYQIFGDYLALAWKDGHESLLSQEQLRGHCPCAQCRGEPDLLGRRQMPADTQAITAESYRLTGLKQVGRYAMQLFWEDGHSTGLYTFEFLRSLCDCDQCRANV